MSLIDQLAQDQVWITRERDEIKIEDLEDKHLSSIIWWLKQNCESLKQSAEAEMKFQNYKGHSLGTEEAKQPDPLEEERDEFLRMSPAEWLNATPMMERLLAEQASRERSRLRAGKRVSYRRKLYTVDKVYTRQKVRYVDLRTDGATLHVGVLAEEVEVV